VGIGVTIGLAKSLVVTDSLLIESISLIFIVEAYYDVFFWHIEEKVPNLAPFDTGISEIWVYNLALLFIILGSYCVEILLLILLILNVSNPIVANYTKSFF